MTRKKLQDRLIGAYRETEECPPPEAWLAEEMGRLRSAERQRLEAHSESCPRCAAERKLASEFDRASLALTAEEVRGLEEALDPGSDAEVVDLADRRGSRMAKWPVALATAASLALAVGLMLRLDLSRPPSLPQRTDSDVVRNTRIDAISPVGGVEEVPVTLVWSPIENAGRYSVVIRKVDRSQVWMQSTDEATIVLPDGVRQRLLPGVTYTWSVEALALDGSFRARSETIAFTIEPRVEE